MNIAPIPVFKTNIYEPQINHNLLFKSLFKPLKDSFVRQNQRPSNEDYKTKLENFKKDIEQYVLKTPKITRSGLYQILRKYSNNVKLKNFNGKNLPNKKTVAQYSITLSYKPAPAKAIETAHRPIISINIPKKQDKFSRAEFLGSIVHEMVHLFQDEERAKKFGENYIKKYYDKAKNTKEMDSITNAVEQLYYGFSKFEQNIFILTENFLNECHLESYANIENFDKFLKYGHNMNFRDIAKLLIEDTYYNSGDNIIDTLGTTAIIDCMKYKLGKELEAYSIENEVIQKHSPNKIRKMEAKFTVEVYRELLDIVNNIKLERTN